MIFVVTLINIKKHSGLHELLTSLSQKRKQQLISSDMQKLFTNTKRMFSRI